MLQVDVLHFSHFPTWQTLGLWLCLGLSGSGSWILILARGSLWQAHSLVRMWGASSALALESPAEAALLLLPGAGGQWSRPCPCLCLCPLTFVSACWSWWNRGSRLHPFQSHQPGHSLNDLGGNQHSRALTPPPAGLNTGACWALGLSCGCRCRFWRCRMQNTTWKHKYKDLNIRAQSSAPGALESRKITTLQCAVKVFALLTIGPKKMKCWFHSFHCVSLGLTGFQIGVTTGWVSLWWCQRAAQAWDVTSEQCSAWDSHCKCHLDL